MKLIHPTDLVTLEKRNHMLFEALRTQDSELPIEKEYPIVLSAENLRYSYCLTDQDTICSHANLWPRILQDRSHVETIPVGLVGNVATAESHRGRGLMKDLMDTLEQEAQKKGLSALILWSDLSEFYHRLGFESLGKEFHFSFETMDLEPLTDIQVKQTKLQDIDRTLLQKLLALRYPISRTLQRSLSDYEQLIHIPSMELYTAWKNDNLCAFGWIGKGADMSGVIHEWGAQEPEMMIDLSSEISKSQKLQQVMILSPHELRDDWLQIFLEESFLSEVVPMAFIKILDESKREALEDMFIWGLDSI